MLFFLREHTIWSYVCGVADRLNIVIALSTIVQWGGTNDLGFVVELDDGMLRTVYLGGLPRFMSSG
jgi:hypothetical protein